MTLLPEDIRNSILSLVQSEDVENVSSGLNITNESIINEIKKIDFSFSVRDLLLSTLKEYRKRQGLAYKLYTLIKDIGFCLIELITHNNRNTLFIRIKPEDNHHIKNHMNIPEYKEDLESGWKGDVIKEGKPTIIDGCEVYTYNYPSLDIYSDSWYCICVECSGRILINDLLGYLSDDQKEFYTEGKYVNRRDGLQISDNEDYDCDFVYNKPISS